MERAIKSCEALTRRVRSGTKSVSQLRNVATLWELANPISHRHYLLRDKLTRWNGRLARLEFAVDTTEKENISQAVQRKLDIESTLLECIRILNREENFPQAVDMVLENLQAMTASGRSCLYLRVQRSEKRRAHRQQHL